jgi:hypothetical protein
MNLFNLGEYSAHKQKWAHPYYARKMAIERCLERAELDCNEIRVAALRAALDRVQSYTRLYDALKGN